MEGEDSFEEEGEEEEVRGDGGEAWVEEQGKREEGGGRKEGGVECPLVVA